VPEIEALAEGEAERFERQGRLAAWFLQWLPRYVAVGVNIGIATAFNEKAELPPVPDSFEALLKTLPDYRQDCDG